MIQFTRAFVTTDNQTHADIKAAQRHELCLQIKSITGGSVEPEEIGRVADALLQKPAVFVDVLTMSESSRPKARKVNGGTRKRKNAQPAESSTTQPAAPTN